MPPDKASKRFFRISYRDPVESKTITLKARAVGDSSLGLSFIKVSDFVFDLSALVVSPEEESLQKRLANIRCIHLSIYTILSIEEVGFEGDGLKFKTKKSNLLSFPSQNPKPTQPH